MEQTSVGWRCDALEQRYEQSVWELTDMLLIMETPNKMYLWDSSPCFLESLERLRAARPRGPEVNGAKAKLPYLGSTKHSKTNVTNSMRPGLVLDHDPKRGVKSTQIQMYTT